MVCTCLHKGYNRKDSLCSLFSSVFSVADIFPLDSLASSLTKGIAQMRDFQFAAHALQ
jgi:hypothetical protein